MVKVRYKGLNILYVGSYALKAGYNDMKDEDFYKLMQTKLFRHRVEQKILEVPIDFPLEKNTQKEHKNVPSEDEEIEGKLSVKSILKLIEKAKDISFLKRIIEQDGRSRVIEEAKKKLELLERQ